MYQKYYVYFLQSLKDGSIYIGQTCDLNARLGKHNGGSVRSTKYKRPWRLIYSEIYETKLDACKREWVLKHPKGYQDKLGILHKHRIFHCGVEQPGSSSGS